MSPTPQINDLDRPIDDAISRIERLNDGLRRFWSAAAGWAPDSAAALMSKSRLDWQVSLSRSLRHWTCDPPENLEEGDLILGWANLGSLIEGTIKLFLAVHYESYKSDVETLKTTKAWHNKKQKLLDPDGLVLDTLIDYVEKADLFAPDEIDLCKFVQARRPFPGSCPARAEPHEGHACRQGIRERLRQAYERRRRVGGPDPPALQQGRQALGPG
jgi:hypothetical protein